MIHHECLVCGAMVDVEEIEPAQGELMVNVLSALHQHDQGQIAAYYESVRADKESLRREIRENGSDDA